MGFETLYNLIRKPLTLDGIEGVTFIWHGVEPSLAGSDFYREVVRLQAQFGHGVRVVNQMQTNGTIDHDLLDFLIDSRFGIGVSLDGPRDLHDRQRFYRGTAASSFDDVLVTIRRLNAHGKGAGVIAVVTQHSLGRAAEIYNFLADTAGSFKFRPMNPIGAGARVKDSIGITPHEYAGFLREIFPLWVEDKRKKRVAPFSEALEDMLSGVPQHCSSAPSCARGYLSVTPDGQVYSCGGFDGNPAFHYGDINSEELADILRSPNRQAIIETRKDVPACRGCEYRTICNSGCMVSSYMRRGSPSDKD